MREPRYSILSDINDGIDRAKQGKLALYWQRNIEHEYRCKKVTPAEQQAYTDLQDILAAVPQWSDEEELRSGMEGICKHQLGRRNLTPEQKKFLIGKQYHSEKSTRGGNHGNQYTQVANCQIDNLPSVENTTERIAKENNVSPSFVIRAEQFMKTVELMEKYCPGIQEEILSGKLKLSQREATIIRGTPTEALPTVVSTWREEKLNGKPDDSADTYENSELLSKVTENNFSTAAISKIQTPDPLSENRPFISSGRRSTELQTIREPGEKMATVDSILEIGNAVSSTNNENQQDAVDTALAA